MPAMPSRPSSIQRMCVMLYTCPVDLLTSATAMTLVGGDGSEQGRPGQSLAFPQRDRRKVRRAH